MNVGGAKVSFNHDILGQNDGDDVEKASNFTSTKVQESDLNPMMYSYFLLSSFCNCLGAQLDPVGPKVILSTWYEG